MGDENYFVITSGEDGISISRMSRKELEKSLKDDEWGKVKFLKHLPSIDKGCFQDNDEDEPSTLIIKGEIVIPKPVTKVTEYEIQ